MRPPGFKGALRFWWRAISFARFAKEAGGDAAGALKALWIRESELFGSSAGAGEGGQGRFLLRLSSSAEPSCWSPQGLGQGRKYLLGQGLSHQKALDFKEDSELAAELTFKRSATPEDRLEVAQALLSLGLLGGLGARARRGWGSLALHSFSGVDLEVPRTSGELEAWASDLITGSLPTLPPFSAFSGTSRVAVGSPAALSREAHEAAGSKFQSYRRGVRADARMVAGWLAGEPVEQAPQRIVFGLPHNYFLKGKGKVEIQGTNSKRDRRASPLLIHIHRFDGEKKTSYAPVYTFLPSALLAPDDELLVKVNETAHAVPIPSRADFALIERFLDEVAAEAHKS